MRLQPRSNETKLKQMNKKCQKTRILRRTDMNSQRLLALDPGGPKQPVQSGKTPLSCKQTIHFPSDDAFLFMLHANTEDVRYLPCQSGQTSDALSGFLSTSSTSSWPMSVCIDLGFPATTQVRLEVSRARSSFLRSRTVSALGCASWVR